MQWPSEANPMTEVEAVDNTLQGRAGGRLLRKSRHAVFLALLVAGGIGLTIVFSRALWLPWIGTLVSYPQPSRLPPADVVVVLGGDQGRLASGLRLCEQGLARELWETGADGGKATVSLSGNLVRRTLPSASTWEDGAEIRKAMRKTGAKRLIIVTSWYHGRRAMTTIEKQLGNSGVELSYSSARTDGYNPQNWWKSKEGQQIVKSELLKLLYYLVVHRVVPWG